MFKPLTPPRFISRKRKLNFIKQINTVVFVFLTGTEETLDVK